MGRWVFGLLWFFLGVAVEGVNMMLRWGTVSWSTRIKPRPAVAVTILGLVLRLLWTAAILALAIALDPLWGASVFLGYWISRWMWIWFVTVRNQKKDK